MALNSDEAAEAFGFLATALREAELGWVVTQVEEKLALGKVETKKLRASGTPARSVMSVRVEPNSKQSAADVFAVAEQYSVQERLDVLLESIVLAVPAVTEVVTKTFDNLAEFGLAARLEFAPEAEVTVGFSLEAETIHARREANARLVSLIDELRRGGDSANQS